MHALCKSAPIVVCDHGESLWAQLISRAVMYCVTVRIIDRVERQRVRGWAIGSTTLCRKGGLMPVHDTGGPSTGLDPEILED